MGAHEYGVKPPIYLPHKVEYVEIYKVRVEGINLSHFHLSTGKWYVRVT